MDRDTLNDGDTWRASSPRGDVGNSSMTMSPFSTAEAFCYGKSHSTTARSEDAQH